MTEMSEKYRTLFRAFAEGFAAPDGSGNLPPQLSGEAGLQLAVWLREEGVTAEMISEAEHSFSDLAERNLSEIGWEGVKDLLRTLIFQKGFHQSGFFMAFLQEAINRVDGPQQWQGLLFFLRRTAALIILMNASGHSAAPPSLAAPQPVMPAPTPPPAEMPPTQERPRFCVFCGRALGNASQESACLSCGGVRASIHFSSTMRQCHLCQQWTPLAAPFCEWCGRDLREPPEKRGWLRRAFGR